MDRAKKPAQTPHPPTRFTSRRTPQTNTESNVDTEVEENVVIPVTGYLNQPLTNTDITEEESLNIASTEVESQQLSIVKATILDIEVDALEKEHQEARLICLECKSNFNND
ncbi:hypothetical protein L6452_32355 [Arctium lappa]|uniref:Uncharacterized protein n=1 Tax=Arctium lappa TaxID=4217 RepID=A0ACB8Z588_ARCLA|nr:hypothetical protein L6452_32355 [Arctium lappa]